MCGNGWSWFPRKQSLRCLLNSDCLNSITFKSSPFTIVNKLQYYNVVYTVLLIITPV